MNVTKKVLLGLGALMLPLCTVLLTGTGAASAAGRTAQPGGTLTCNKISGTIKFKPPLTNTGTATETDEAVKIKVGGCTLSGGTAGQKAPKKGTIKGNLASGTSTNSCGSLEGTQPGSAISLTVKWSSGDGTSAVSFTDFSTSTAGNGNEQINLPSSTGSGSVAGSYPTSSATAQAVLNEMASTLGDTCASSGGLKSVKVASGSGTL